MIDVKNAIRKTGSIEWCSCCNKVTPDNKRITFAGNNCISGGTSIVLCPECVIELFEKMSE